MKELVEELLYESNIIYVGKKTISRARAKTFERYLIYLPLHMNELWEKLHRLGSEVEVILALKKRS